MWLAEMVEALEAGAFLGRWRVRRHINDTLTGMVTRFRGSARISPSSFHEEGETRFGQHRFPAQRHYSLEWLDSAIVVRRSSGSPFITLAPLAEQEVTHHCGDDLYRGRFLFADRGRWSETWTVTGPRKNYRSVTCYRRDHD